MKLVKRFFLVVMGLVGELWTGYISISPQFYDKHSAAKSKIGYVFFVTLAALATIGIATWLYLSLY